MSYEPFLNMIIKIAFFSDTKDATTEEIETSTKEEIEKSDDAFLKVEETPSRRQSKTESTGGFFSFFRRRSSAAISDQLTTDTEQSSDDEKEEIKDTLLEEQIIEESSDREGKMQSSTHFLDFQYFLLFRLQVYLLTVGWEFNL